MADQISPSPGPIPTRIPLDVRHTQNLFTPGAARARKCQRAPVESLAPGSSPAKITEWQYPRVAGAGSRALRGGRAASPGKGGGGLREPTERASFHRKYATGREAIIGMMDGLGRRGAALLLVDSAPPPLFLVSASLRLREAPRGRF